MLTLIPTPDDSRPDLAERIAERLLDRYNIAHLGRRILYSPGGVDEVAAMIRAVMQEYAR